VEMRIRLFRTDGFRKVEISASAPRTSITAVSYVRSGFGVDVKINTKIEVKT
jgi:hypothetical protein